MHQVIEVALDYVEKELQQHNKAGSKEEPAQNLNYFIKFRKQRLIFWGKQGF